MNAGWVAAVDSFFATTTLNGSWFTEVVFVPLIEVADYGLRESMDPDGVPAKQDRARVLRMVGDVNFQVHAGFDGSNAIWVLVWYIARFGKEETDNAVANSAGGGLVNYDPLQTPAPFLFMQNSIVEHRMTVGASIPGIASAPERASEIGLRSTRFDKRMSLPMKTDDELYLVFSASIAQTTETPPIVAVNYLLRFLMTD